MGFTRDSLLSKAVNVGTYPGYLTRRGTRQLLGLTAKAFDLACFYDLGRRLAAASGLPQGSGRTLGTALFKEAAGRGFFLRGAALEGDPQEILAAVKTILPPNSKRDELTVEQLKELRIIPPAKNSLPGKLTAAYDQFVPVAGLHALDLLVSEARQQLQSLDGFEQEIEQVKAREKALVTKARENIHHLGLGNQAYMEIMSAVYGSGQGRNLEENVTALLDVVTKWAWQVIGRSADSESAGWLLVNPNGQIGVPYRFVLGIKGQEIADAQTMTLRRNGSSRELALTLEDDQTPVKVDNQLGRFIALEEWENLAIREDLIALEKQDGSRVLYRRKLLPVTGMVKAAIKGMLGGLAGQVAETVATIAGEFKDFGKAVVELEEITLDQANLSAGAIIPLVPEGTIIKIVSAGSADPNLRERKIAKGLKLEEACRQGGQEAGVINQKLESSVGNVRTSALKPVALMIEDVDQFKVRDQNRLLISVVGVESYFLRSLFEFNERGEAVCLGCLEVTNPEIIPDKLSPEEEKRLMEQFEAGRIFASLASTGIMIKVLQEELNNLTRQYVGEKVYALIRSRDIQSLSGRQIDNATILFADISGFTALSDILQDQPEEVVGLLRRLFAKLDPLVTQQGGMIDKHIGDCIMGVFGVPHREPGDIEQAVSAVINLQMELQRLNLDPAMQAIYQQHGLKPLGMSIGLHTGRVIAGNIGDAKSKIEYTVIGDAVNQAARLQHAVTRGQVLIGEKTYDSLSAEYKAKLVKEFNDYNRTLNSPSGREYIQDFLRQQGIVIDQARLDRIINNYQQLYREAEETDLFVPCTIYAKNKGVLPGYFVRWDRHAYRYEYLRQAIEKAGVALTAAPKFENQPLIDQAAVSQMWSGESEERRAELAKAYLELQTRQSAKLRKS